MSNNSIIEHRANYYYIEFREEFLIICMNLPYKKPGKDGKKSAASPHCEALILSILENWTNNKRGRKEDLSIFMTYRQWSEAMYEMFGRTAIIDSLDELEGNKLLSRSHYKMIGNKDTYKYELKYQELNKLVRALPERNLHDTHPKTDASTNNKPVDPSKNERDASKNGRDTRSETDAYPSKNGHNITSTQNLNTTSQREGSKPDNLEQNTSPTKPSPLTSFEQEFINCFTSLIEKHTGWKNFKAVLPAKSHTDYATFQELADRNPSHEEMERVFLAFWNKQDRDKKYFWRNPETFKLNTFCRNYGAMLDASTTTTTTHEQNTTSDELSEEEMARIAAKNKANIEKLRARAEKMKSEAAAIGA